MPCICILFNGHILEQRQEDKICNFTNNFEPGIIKATKHLQAEPKS